jgi:hypothetical protein
MTVEVQRVDGLGVDKALVERKTVSLTSAGKSIYHNMNSGSKRKSDNDSLTNTCSNNHIPLVASGYRYRNRTGPYANVAVTVD